MIFACQHCSGLEPYIIVAFTTAVVAARGWLAYTVTITVARVFGWFRPVKPECQSCGSFIFCAIDDVAKCQKSKPWYYRLRLRLWRKRR